MMLMASISRGRRMEGLIGRMPVFLLAVVAARLLTRARLGDTPCLLTLLAAFGLLAAHNLTHYLRGSAPPCSL